MGALSNEPSASGCTTRRLLFARRPGRRRPIPPGDVRRLREVPVAVMGMTGSCWGPDPPRSRSVPGSTAGRPGRSAAAACAWGPGGRFGLRWQGRYVANASSTADSSAGWEVAKVILDAAQQTIELRPMLLGQLLYNLGPAAYRRGHITVHDHSDRARYIYLPDTG